MPEVFERWMQRIRKRVDRFMNNTSNRRTHSGNSDDEEDDSDESGADANRNAVAASGLSPLEAELPARYRYGGRRKSISAERYDPEKDADDDELVVNPKSDEQRERLKQAVKGILILRSLDGDQMQQLLDAMFARDVQPGENVIEVGDDGDNFYVIESGTFDIIVPIDGQMTRVAQYEGKGAFGELALMYNQPRSATVRATSRGRLWALDRKSFRKIVVQSAFRKRKLYEALLEKVEILAALTPAERTNLADALVPKTFVAGNNVVGDQQQVIIRQGDQADGMYFIVDGKCSVEIQQSDGTKKVITTLGKGDYFGELALINRKPRAASVYAEGAKTTVAFLDVGAFERMLGPCIDIMKRKMSQYQ